MQKPNRKKHIGIIGGGPAALFVFQTLVASGQRTISIDIFESKKRLGLGMPYSPEGAGTEHVTNVSGNEIPELVTPVVDWISSLPAASLEKYELDPLSLTEFKVLPRLLFGEYLSVQFDKLLKKAAKSGIDTCVHLESKVTDVKDHSETSQVTVEVANSDFYEFDHVIICTGHNWPAKNEGNTTNYFDSPYPPSKLKKRFNHPIAIRGSSLTAIDAIRTISRANGRFVEEGPHKLSFVADKASPDFKIAMHSIQGLLPGIRFHLEDTHLNVDSFLSKEDIFQHIVDNQGFLSLDFFFEKNFKDSFKTKDPKFYDSIKDMKMEEFVETMMTIREKADAFALFKSEYKEAAQSIRRHESVYWKEMLSALSFAMNYPAKHLCAEDMLRLKKALMPLISVVIAFVPQRSCEELIALYDAGRLEIISVDDKSKAEPHPDGGALYKYGEELETWFPAFIDCIGQPPLSIADFPFKGLVDAGVLSAARLKFRDAEKAKELKEDGNKEVEQDDKENFFLCVPGVAITDSFRVIDEEGTANSRIYMMAVPYIGGFNPDYSGLDFCEEASKRIVEDILNS